MFRDYRHVQPFVFFVSLKKNMAKRNSGLYLYSEKSPEIKTLTMWNTKFKKLNSTKSKVRKVIVV